MIKVSPEELESLASRLQGYSSEITSMASAIANCFTEGTANFEGNTATRFDEHFEKMRPIIAHDLPDLLSEFAEEPVKTANRFRELDG